jgi:hypothetical protein
MKRFILTAVLALGLVRPHRAGAQTFGTSPQGLTIPWSAFTPAESGYAFASVDLGGLAPQTDGEQRWSAPIVLPSGSVVQELDALVRDTDASSDIDVTTTMYCFPIGATIGSGAFGMGFGTSSGLNGEGLVAIANPFGTSPLLGRGDCNSFASYFYYAVTVTLRTTSHSLAGVHLTWSRTVSPAPPEATFADVPTSHPFFQFVEALADSGITAGCGSGNYCPDAALTRGQMAVFLAKALGLYWPEN